MIYTWRGGSNMYEEVIERIENIMDQLRGLRGHL